MTRMTRITEHVRWMPPDEPDRPSLCAVVGGRRTLNARRRIVARAYQEFLRALAAEGAARPFAVVCTHSHCDSVTKGRQLASELG